MISIIGVIGVFPIVIFFGICFGLTVRSYVQNPNRIKIYYMIWTLSVALIYISWGARVLFIPQFEKETSILYPFWALSYAFGGLALISLDFATLNLTKNKESKIMKYIKIIIIINYFGILVVLLMGFEMELIVFMDVSDLIIKDIYIYVFFTLSILFYISFPNYIFISYLIKSPEKDSFAYKRVRIIELGILLFTVGLAFDGMRFPSNIGILIIRIIIAIGGLITMKGFLMKPPSK